VCKVLATTDNEVVRGIGVVLCDGRSSGIIGYQNQDGRSPANNIPQEVSTNAFTPFTSIAVASKTGEYVSTLIFRPSVNYVFGDLLLASSTTRLTLGQGLLGVNVYWGVTYPNDVTGAGNNMGAVSLNYACPVPTPMPTTQPTAPTPPPTPAPTIGQIRHCVINSIPRGAGTIPNGCGRGGEYQGLLCYPLCQAGYYGVGPVCYKYCDESYTVSGARSGRSMYPPLDST